ncbi:MAG TPA: ubiquitin carboxyl-terminal hydrolase family protein, partial [Rhabdochlamydiaceae bacterium]|nr:ubiquitin carboxyl-terminal hydrolase family protein [Rhabdochlamydiaceae bacterium]
FFKSVFWALVSTIIGTAGEILQRTTRIETPIAPAAIYLSPVVLKEGQFPGIPNMGNTGFMNAPMQAIMADSVYPGVYKEICERAKARHINFKNFLELYTAQSGFLSSFAWPKMFSKEDKDESPLNVVNVRDVLVMLMRQRSSLNYDSQGFQERYPIIHQKIGEFSKVRREADFPQVADDNPGLQKEFTLMKKDPPILRFFDKERAEITNKILGFDAYLSFIHAYEIAVEQKLPIVSFGRWSRTPIGNICHLIHGAGGNSQKDVEEFLHCLSEYVLPGDFPEVFFPLAYERRWEECPEAEQDSEKLQELIDKHKNPRDENDLLTVIPNDKKIVDAATPENILKIKTLLREGVSGASLLEETFQTKKAATGPHDPNKQTHYYINTVGIVRKYYLVEEKIIPPKKSRMPERIILELIRYKWKGEENEKRQEKIGCAITMPKKIKICGKRYQLKSIVLHDGVPEKGHYYTIINKQGQYWYASDATVGRAEEEHVRQADKDGYLYFYEKCPRRLKLEDAL